MVCASLSLSIAALFEVGLVPRDLPAGQMKGSGTSHFTAELCRQLPPRLIPNLSSHASRPPHEKVLPFDVDVVNLGWLLTESVPGATDFYRIPRNPHTSSPTD